MALQTEEVWKTFNAQLRHFILGRVSDEAAADDILQDVFVRIHIRLDTVREDDKLQSWIYQIARNAIVDFYRARSPTEELPFSLVEPETDAGEQAKQENSPYLRPMIQRLPERYREAMRLSEIEELPHKEIAARLGLSVSGVKSRVQRGRALLREMLLSSCRFEFDSRGMPIDYDGDNSRCGDQCTSEESA